MNGREARNGISLMIFDGSFDVVIAQIYSYSEIFFGLFLVDIFEHGLDDASSGKPDLFFYFLTYIVAALPFDLSDVALGELSQQLPNQMNLLLPIFGERLAKRLDNLFTLLGLFIDFAQNGPQVLVDIFLEHFS